MLDIALLRNNTDEVKNNLGKRGVPSKDVDDFIRLDKEWREATEELQNLRFEQKQLGEARKIKEAKALKVKIKDLEVKLVALAQTREKIWLSLPNLTSDDVPEGKDESGNKEIRRWSQPTQFSFEPQDHLTLGENLGIIDTEKASRVSGARFSYLKGDAALLEFSLVQFAFSILTNEKTLRKIAKKAGLNCSTKPFLPVVPPTMIKPDVYRRMARLDDEVADERYYLPKDDMYLIGSAEHTLGPLHMDETIPSQELPLRYVGFSTSYRREAGTYGKDAKGIFRVHQFDKVEMESFSAPENSILEQDFIIAIQEYFMQELNIPYRVTAVCTGDMSSPDFRQVDIESWLPSQNCYRETHTSDLMTDYQARRLGTKFKQDNEIRFVHMNDATAFAIGRTIIAIMENHQTAQGQINIPKVLQRFMGKKVIG